MCLEQFQRCGGTHLGGDDAGQIIFYMDDVDAGELSILNDDFEGTQKTLVFLALPMEIDADGNVQ